jgi:CspA family cold shock protein
MQHSLHKTVVIVMPEGSVKWFNNAKGYGFIIADDSSKELSAHYSAIAMKGYKTLLAGEVVEFDLQQCDKGLQAKKHPSLRCRY